jgi:murein DD-endopeptidase MepM/ murein hydrolase activator NlpD
MMGRRLLLPGALGFLLALMLALVAPAAGQDITSQKADVDRRIADLRRQIDAANAREGVLTSQLSDVAATLRDAEGDVSVAAGRLSGVETDLAHEHARLEELTALLRVHTARVDRLDAQYGKAVALLGAHLRALYILGEPDAVEVLLSARSFSELLDGIDLMDRIARQDKRLGQQVAGAKAEASAERLRTAGTRAEVSRAVSLVEARVTEQRDALRRVTESRNALAAARDLKADSLAAARQSREEYLAEVEALAAESATLAVRIRAAQGGGGSSGSGASASGLIWPVSGPVTSGFGMRWGRMHEGIDIAVPSGTPVHASASGQVIYAGWLGGYGNLVVIDHGDGLATAYAHNSSLSVGVGASVSQGQAISLSGSTGNSSGPHVHFEVRVNGTAVDPLAYL